MTAHIIYFPRHEEPTARIYQFPASNEPIREFHPLVNVAIIGSCAVVSWFVVIEMGIWLWGIFS